MKTKEEIINTINILDKVNNLKEIITIYLENKKNEEFLAKNYILKPNSENIKKAVYFFEEIVNYKDDKEFIGQISQNYPVLFLLASDELRKNTEFIKELLNQGRAIYHYIKDDLKDDREIIKITLKTCAYVLNKEWYTKNYRDDKELVLIVLANHPHILKSVSPRLLDDRDVVKAALSLFGGQYIYVPNKFLHDKELVEIALTDSNANIYDDLPKIFQDDYQLILNSVKINPYLIKQLPDNYTNDAEIILALFSDENMNNMDKVWKNETPLDYIGKDLGNNLLLQAKNKQINIDSKKEKITFFKTVLEKLILTKKLAQELKENPIKSRLKL